MNNAAPVSSDAKWQLEELFRKGAALRWHTTSSAPNDNEARVLYGPKRAASVYEQNRREGKRRAVRDVDRAGGLGLTLVHDPGAPRCHDAPHARVSVAAQPRHDSARPAHAKHGAGQLGQRTGTVTLCSAQRTGYAERLPGCWREASR